MKQAKNIAICGATGMVGQAFLDLLETKYFQDSHITLLARSKSEGKEILLRNKIHVVKDLKKFNFSNTDFALFSVGASVSEIYAPIAVSQGCVVIDNSSCFRYEEDIPLVVPEVNGEILKNYSLPNIIANPNCEPLKMEEDLPPFTDE